MIKNIYTPYVNICKPFEPSILICIFGMKLYSEMGGVLYANVCASTSLLLLLVVRLIRNTSGC